MREYGKVQTEFWEHPGVRRLSTDAKLLYVYLLTGPHTNMAGCFKAPIGYIADDLGWVSDTVSKGFAELSEEGFATFDAESRFVLIHGFLKHNQIANPKMAIGMMKWFREVPEASSLKPMLAAEVIEHVAHLPTDLAKEAERFLIPSQKPYAERYAKPENREQGTEDIGTSSLLSDQGPTEIAANDDSKPSTALTLIGEPSAPTKRGKTKAEPSAAERENFAAFWSVYPRREGKQPALLAFVAAIRAGVDPNRIAAGAQRYAAARQGQDPKLTKMAQGWLNDRRWEDEIAEPPPGGYRDHRSTRDAWDPMQQAIDGMDFNRDDAA